MRRNTTAQAAKLSAAERRAKAVTLRKTGATYAHIAQVLGVTAPTAHRYCKQALEALRNKTKADAEELVELECVRFDSMLMALWPKIALGNEAAIAQAISISRERRKLLGLDAPNKTANTHADGTDIEQPEPLTDDERLARIVAVLDAARARINRVPGAGPQGGSPDAA